MWRISVLTTLHWSLDTQLNNLPFTITPEVFCLFLQFVWYRRTNNCKYGNHFWKQVQVIKMAVIPFWHLSNTHIESNCLLLNMQIFLVLQVKSNGPLSKCLLLYSRNIYGATAEKQPKMIIFSFYLSWKRVHVCVLERPAIGRKIPNLRTGSEHWNAI